MGNEISNQEKVSPYKKKAFASNATLMNILLFILFFVITAFYRYLEEKPQLVNSQNVLSFIFSTSGFMVVTAIIGFAFAYGIHRKKDSKERNKHGLIYSIFIILLFAVVDVAMKIQEPKSNTNKVASEQKEKKFHSDEGMYSISFPGNPERRTVEAEIPDYGKVIFKIEILQTGMAIYAVSFVDFNNLPDMSNEQIKQALLLWRDSSIGNANGKLLGSSYTKIVSESKEIHNGVYFYAEVINKNNQKNMLYAKQFFIKKRLYQTQIVTAINQTSKKEIDDFFDSFECFY